MTRNDALDFARRLYERVPAHYRAYDADPDQAYALLALLRVVAEQVASVRQDLDALWDNFFIETSDDWVVPYIGALVDAHLLAQPVGQSNRLDVYNTISWRRRRGTPAMLRALAPVVSGWPADLAEFFQALGWSQNLNHLRLSDPLTPDLRDPYPLSLLGRAADPLDHAADFKPAGALDGPRVTPASLGIGRAAWGTPGRYTIKNLGFFVRRLQTFPLQSVTPAAAPPGPPLPADAACFTFDSLFRDTPLFVEATREPLTRAAFAHDPTQTFGRDVAVRQFGVLLASEVAPQAATSSANTRFDFGSAAAGLSLDSGAGLRLPAAQDFDGGAAHFILTAYWEDAGGATPLGALSTLLAAQGDPDAFHLGEAVPGAGRLLIGVACGGPGVPASPPAGLGWPGLPPSPPAAFPGAVLAIRLARPAAPQAADALYVYLPAVLLYPGAEQGYYVAEDGSTYTDPALDLTMLARDSEGQVFPPRPLTTSTVPAAAFTVLNRGPGGMVLLDAERFNGVEALVQAEIFTGAFQHLGAVPTTGLAASDYPQYRAPDPWPAFAYAPSVAAVEDDLPSEGLLALRVQPLAGDFIPQAEVVLANRAGSSLLVYLPEVRGADAEGVRFFVAEDGATYLAPTDSVRLGEMLAQQSLAGLNLGRASAGQVLPIPGVWPLQQRRPVALDLCACARQTLLRPGELGIDPERGWFALAPGDPAIGSPDLTVDYVEAFSDRVGAHTFDRQLDSAEAPTRLVALSGDAARPGIGADRIYASLADALAQATEETEVIEIADSGTYRLPGGIVFNQPGVRRLVIRAAADQRPCLSLHATPGTGLPPGEFRIATDLESLELSGLWIAGGPLRIDSAVQAALFSACTLDPRDSGGLPALVAADNDLNHSATYLLCRCIAGAVRVGAGIERLIVADSIVDRRGGLAIGGLPLPGEFSPPFSPPLSPPFSPPVEFSPPFSPPVEFSPPLSPPFSPPLSPPLPEEEPPAQTVQLERVTVLGRVHCAVLEASECLLEDLVLVEDQQAGCIRFSRYEPGSVLPRRYQCVPTDAQLAACDPILPCQAPLFNSRRFGRPDYVQLAAAGPAAIRTASEQGSEVGAFAGALNTIRLNNLNLKIAEFLPVGLTSVVIAET